MWCAVPCGAAGWLELDFDPEIAWIGGEPVELHWQGRQGRRRWRPDFVVRTVTGARRVVLVEPETDGPQWREDLMETAAFEAALADHVEDPYDTLALYAAVVTLSERQRDAILLHYGMGFSAAEAAVLMGNEEATVRSQLRTGRQRLANLLKLRCPEHPDGKNHS